MTEMNERRILLDPDCTPEVFRAVADAAGWELIRESPPSGLLALELIYRPDAAATTTIHYVEDSYIKVRYAVVRGPQADPFAEDLMERVAYAPVEVVLEAAEDESEGLQHVISWMLSATALADQAGHARLVRLIEARLRHGNAAVRRVALVAATWLEWPDFRATVERLASDDPDQDVRSQAGKLAAAYRMRDEGKV